MTIHGFRRPWAVAAVSLLLPLAAACGGPSAHTSSAAGDSGSSQASSGAASSDASASGGLLAVPSDADTATKDAYLEENLIATCMRKQGFSYTPHVEGASDPLAAGEGEDYTLAKQFREKYGFGLYAGAVYPDDPKAPLSKASQAQDDVDARYEASLTPAQRTAYDKALGGVGAAFVKNGSKTTEKPSGCEGAAQRKVEGPPKSQAEIAKETKAQDEVDKENGQALNGDPKLIALAQSYASCLRDQGIPVTTTQPTSIGDMVKFQVSATLPPDGTSHLSKQQALPLLTHEITLAMEDLTCGKAFRAAYFPALKKHPYVGDEG